MCSVLYSPYITCGTKLITRESLKAFSGRMFLKEHSSIPREKGLITTLIQFRGSTSPSFLSELLSNQCMSLEIGFKGPGQAMSVTLVHGVNRRNNTLFTCGTWAGYVRAQ